MPRARSRPDFIPRPDPGQESVWDYPRPPRVDDTSRHLLVRCAGVTVAQTRRGRRVCETSTPPAYYFPPENVRREYLIPNQQQTVCEWKGAAQYYDVRVGDQVVQAAAWVYPDPTPGYERIRGYLAFYPHRLECSVDGERARPQQGTFYGGWITSDVVGPFKGGPGTEPW